MLRPSGSEFRSKDYRSPDLQELSIWLWQKKKKYMYQSGLFMDRWKQEMGQGTREESDSHVWLALPAKHAGDMGEHIRIKSVFLVLRILYKFTSQNFYPNTLYTWK